MTLNIVITPSEETLMKLDEKFVPVSEERFMYSLQQGKWDIEKVNTFISQLKTSYLYTSEEYARILRFKETYNLEYPSDHKRYFSTAVELMSKMRSTLSTYKKIIVAMRQKKRRGKPHGNDVNDYSQMALLGGPFSQDMFGWEVYDSIVQDMFNSLNRYLQLASDCLDTCMVIIEEENAIRSDPELAYPRYEYSFDRSVNGNRGLIQLMEAANADIGNDLVKAMEEAEDSKKLIAEMFHEMGYQAWNSYCACKTISDGRKQGLTKEESLLFGKENAVKVIRVRALLDHVLELAEQHDDVIGWEGMLSGKFVMHLLYWCGWNGSKNEALLKYVTKRCEGRVRVAKMGAVLREKRLAFQQDNDVRHREQELFNEQIDEFVDGILAQPTAK